MKTLLICSIIISCGFIVIAYIIIFNSFVKIKQKVKESFAGIDVQLKRRYDLIPNLVNVVKSYSIHEQTTLDKVITARQQAINITENQLSSKNLAELELTKSLHQIFALQEAYPVLKANINFLKLQEELVETEDQISAARRIYNSNVSIYNAKVASIPSNIIALIHNFKKEEFFEGLEIEKNNVNTF